MRTILAVLVLVCFCYGNVDVVSAAEKEKTYRLIFSAFDAKSAKEYSYLRDSIQTMLMSRLAANERIEVVDKVLSKEQLTALSQRDTQPGSEAVADADYLVTGGLYALATGLNVHVSMYPFDPSLRVLNFSHVAKTPADIISGSDKLISDIVQELLGKDTAPVEDTAISGTPVSGFTTAHPEEAYKRGQYTGTVVQSELHGIEVKTAGVKRKITVPGEMTGCVAGDLDGNGSIEVVGLAPSRLTVYQPQERKIVPVAEMELPVGLRVHWIDLADLDGDKHLEIYLSATDGLYISSQIIEWNEVTGFTTRAKNIRHYIRPVNLKGKGWILAGQDRGIEKNEFLRKGVYQLGVGKNFELTREGLLPLPEGINLFEFIYTELDGKDGDELVVLSGDEKLRVYNSNNELLWVSTGNYGGSKTYIGPSLGEATDKQSTSGLSLSESEDREIIFVPARIQVTDVNNDGRSEIVVSENESGILGFFKRIRSYSGGTVTGLAWDGSGLTEAWRTGKYKGYIVDYYFKELGVSQHSDITAENVPMTSGLLYVANIPQSGSLVGLLPGVSDTEITIYEMEFYKKKQTDKNGD